jgi:hypothetical protein
MHDVDEPTRTHSGSWPAPHRVREERRNRSSARTSTASHSRATAVPDSTLEANCERTRAQEADPLPVAAIYQGTRLAGLYYPRARSITLLRF